MKNVNSFRHLWNRRFRSVTHCAALLGVLATAADAASASIQSIEAEPAPLVVGGLFQIKVQASPDVTLATASLDFKRANILRLQLVKSGDIWTASGMIPVDFNAAGTSKGTLTVHAFDASRQPAQKTVSVQITALPFNWAAFDPATGVLTITGDNGNNSISVGRDVSGNIVVNGGALPIIGGIPTAANTTLIRVFAFDGNDQVVLEPGNGLPRGELYGGAGNDSLIGGAAADTIMGGPGDDTLFGGLGIDLILGDEGADTLTGGDGNDVLFGGTGTDTLVWNPGDDNDTMEGQADQDTLLFQSANVAETIGILPNGQRLQFTRDIAGINLDVNDVETVQFNARGGADNITVGDLTATDVTAVKVDLASSLGSGDGQPDSVTIIGTPENNDVVVSGSGSNVAVSGLHAQVAISASEIAFDRVTIKTLEGADQVDASGLELGIIQLTVEGGADTDSLTAVADIQVAQLVANASRLNIFRGAADIFDADDVESVVLFGSAEADAIVIGDLAGTDVSEVVVDLFDPEHPDAGDGAEDVVTVNGTQGGDNIVITGLFPELTVAGLSAAITVAGAETDHDRLTVASLGGDDVVNASALPAGQINLDINGGLGLDILTGSSGNDVINGGDGNDVAVGGPGEDLFVWNPGDDNDTLEGQAGVDTLLFNGSNVAETIGFSANGNRLTFTRDIAAITMDTDDVEQVRFVARGGADKITINDLSATDVTGIVLDLFATTAPPTGDAAADVITMFGTAGNDSFTLNGNANGVIVSGTTQLTLLGTELTFDQLIINSLEGDDSVDASGVLAGLLQLIVDGGADNDTLVGSEESDALQGGLGDDVLIGGPGLDLLDGGLGNNVVVQD
jgi:Ca2+-binding RTX toxin-like protein